MRELHLIINYLQTSAVRNINWRTLILFLKLLSKKKYY